MAYIITELTATLIHNAEVVTVTNEDKIYSEFVECLKQGMEDEAYEVFKKAKDFLSMLPAPFTVKDDLLHYHGDPCDRVISKRTIALLEGGFDVTYMLLFMQNLMLNSSKRAVEELYGFLECNDIPITRDGHFMAYKRITQDWKDVYTGKISNRVGNTVMMPRNKVDEDKNRTCSEGLHVCSLNYLKSYGGERLVAVKVNPRDVVSVPTDYNNSKMRVCQYVVESELPMALVGGNEGAYKDPVYTEDEDDEDDFFGLR